MKKSLANGFRFEAGVSRVWDTIIRENFRDFEKSFDPTTELGKCIGR